MSDPDEQRSVILEGQEMPSAAQFAAALFQYEDTDPRSVHYHREIVRPVIRWGRVLLCLAVPVIWCAAVLTAANMLGAGKTAAVIAAAAGVLIWVILFCRRMVICAIQIYQRYAPESLRSKCRFEPSCSQYMILAIEKYGLMRGIRKGICRLGRCRPGDGGFDEP